MTPTPMTQTNPMLAQLKDIHLPEAVSWWPLAWPWWLILAFTVAVICFVIYYRKKNAWRNKALMQLKSFDKTDPVKHAMYCNRLLKQICFNNIDRSCASLSGTAWLEYLDQQVKQPIFLINLTDFAFILDNPDVSIDSDQLTIACRKWIRKAQC